MIAVGVMSGTSLDGIDAALVRIRPAGESYRIDLFNFQTVPFDPKVVAALKEILPPAAGTVAGVARMHRALGSAFADAVMEVESDMPIDYVACHGQTIWHEGSAHVTLQIGDPFLVRDRARASVCFDFRSGDCAAGGQGAPLVPYVDALLLRDPHEDRVAVNIGGIANLTVLPRGCEVAQAVAFDSGPGNMLIDAFVSQRTGGGVRFDRGGELALRGAVHRESLDSLLADPYFVQAPPKTTGRERFGEQFLSARAKALLDLSLEDGAATLAALTAESLAQAIRSVSREGARVLLSGGGARNRAIVDGLKERLPEFRVERSDAMGVHPDAKEAIAFAVLGYETLRGRASNVARATGASRPAFLGAIAPFELPKLLAKVEAECRTS
jgi:anhydro-N-acetylmuramic acid kinase